MTTRAGIRTEYVPCDLCGSVDHDLLFSKIDPVTGMEFHLVECRCGMAFVNPMPVAEAIPLLYPDDYLEGKEHRWAKYRKMLKLLPANQSGKLLDIGCGRGDFINHATRLGWDAEGIDLMDWQSPYPVPIRVGDFLSMDLAGSSYDVITAWALLEHVRKPSLFLERITGLLKPEGRLFFVVPNIAAPGMRYACAEDIPRHLWHFSPAAVRKYLDRYEMEALAVVHNGKIYQAYPFGLLRYGIRRLMRREKSCAAYQNRSVALLANRQMLGNFGSWISEVLRSVGPADLMLDALDMAFALSLGAMSMLIRNYGVITVVAGKRLHPRPI
jgi:SAM-dependent methyltransferase